MLKFSKVTFVVIAVLLCNPLFAQVGGRATYQFLNLVSSAKIASMGGYALANTDADLEMVYFNPALLDSNLHQELNLSYVNYFSDINYGFAGYAHDFKKYGVFALTTKYINYGEFLLADETSQINGTFTASETAINASWSILYKYGLSYGVNLKFVSSNFYDYNSAGVLVDFGGAWTLPESGFRAGLVVRNIGYQLTTYTPGNQEPLPFEILFGASKRLKHAPFRFSINLHNLQTLDLYYESPNDIETTSLFGQDEVQQDENNWADAVFRHFSGSVELLLTDNFEARFGYNHQRRAELSLRDGSRTGAVGFNLGVGVKIKKFKIDYGRSIFSLAGTTNHLSISTNFSEFISKKD